MSRYIHWCLVELETRLSGRVPSAQMQEMLSEFEAHLHDAKHDYECTGLNSSLAELKAVQDFGRPSIVAAESVEALKGNTPQGWFKSNMSYIGIGLGYLALPLFLIGMCYMTLNTFMPAMLTLVTTAGLMFVCGKRPFREIMYRPIFYGAVAVIPLLFVMFGLMFATNPEHGAGTGFPVNRARENIVAEQTRVLPSLKQAMNEFLLAKAKFDQDPELLRTSRGYRAIAMPQTTGWDSEPWTVRSEMYYPALENAWRFYHSGGFEKTVRAWTRESEQRIESYKASLANYPSFDRGRIEEAVLGAFVGAGTILIVNFAAFSMGWLFSRFRVKRLLRA